MDGLPARQQACYVLLIHDILGKLPAVLVGDSQADTIQYHLHNDIPGELCDRRQDCLDDCRMWLVKLLALGLFREIL
jgi:hypothetical protein